ncbi:RNA polymerase subunit sigma-70 [Listeria booriae]|uniref:RNA polymerase subunit sigma-70 n=1 Tax=Listeria booriae TaxID=1552123 RepID=UPI001626BD36|nr:RNA polymerase subunit sigma-70 [Listeria booriae]MBC2205629.1 RNA polymerase subunit sigma-70 [Listeria booriae]
MDKIDLMDLYEKKIVKEGGHNINVPISRANGENYSGKTYSIPLKYLYYNEQNGRIGVELSNYESLGNRLIPGHSEEYNMAIQSILVDENRVTKKDMDELKRDIANKGQADPGYVLRDGRVIDGNRRFTAKRMLEQDPLVAETQYFEAVILDDLYLQNHDDQKRIKSLELQIQFGRLDKVDYSPIDRAVDAYKTIKIKNLMSVKEYANFAGLTPSKVNNRILEAELIVKFLEFANARVDNYALAKQLDMDGPLQDMLAQYRKIKNSDKLDQILYSLFAKIIQMKSSNEEFKQGYREIVNNVIGTKNEENFIEEMEDATDIIVEALEQKEVIDDNHDLFTVLHSQPETVKALAEIKTISTNYSERAKNLKEQNMPIMLANKAISNLEAIDKDVVLGLPDSELIKLNKNLLTLKSKIDELLSEGE